MTTVTVSPTYQVVIPKAIRNALSIKPGQKLVMLPYRGQIVLIPRIPITEAYGFLKGIDTNVDREKDRV